MNIGILKMSNEDYEYKPKNREKKRIPKQGKHWCMVCDGALVGKGERCPNCGKKSLPRRERK